MGLSSNNSPLIVHRAKLSIDLGSSFSFSWNDVVVFIDRKWIIYRFIKVRNILFILLFTLTTFPLSAQSYLKLFPNYWNVSALYAVQCYDSGIAIASQSDSLGKAVLVKTNAYGNTLWASILDSPSFYETLDTTSDGGFIVSGVDTTSLGINFILKLNACGQKEWAHFFRGQEIYRLIQLKDGGYIMAIYQYTAPSSDLFCRLDGNGKPLWSVLFKDAFIGNIIADNYGNFLVSGTGNLDSNLQNIFTSKISPAGVVLWVSIYGDKYGAFTCQTKDKGYLTSFSCEGPTDTIQVLKQDSNGKELWVKQWGDLANGLSDVDMIYDSLDNSYILIEALVNNLYNDTDSVRFVKLDSNANVLKTKKYPYDIPYGWLKYSYDKQILISGNINLTDTTSAYFLWKINSNFEQDSFNDSDHSVYDNRCKTALTDTISLIGADFENIDTNTMTIVSGNTLTTSIVQVNPPPRPKISITPNPFTGVLNVTYTNMGEEEHDGMLRVVNSVGQAVYSQAVEIIPQCIGSFDIDLSKLSKGFYYIVVEDSKSIMYKNGFIKQ